MNPAAAPVRQPAPVPAPAPAPALALGQPNPIRDGLNDLKLELRAQSLIKQIREFDGESSRKFRDWLREIDRAGTIVNATDERYKSFVLQTLRGNAADFLSRVLRLTPDITWARLRESLIQQYSDTGDAHIAKTKLRRLTQRKGETIQNFSERIFALAEEAYAGQPIANPLIQQTLVDVLIEGVENSSISKRLIRERPATLEAALNIAVREQQDAKAFELRRRHEEPMDVSAVTSANDAKFEMLADAIIGLKTQIESVMAVTEKGRSPQQPSSNAPAAHASSNDPHKFQWTSDNKPICFYCKKIGHVQRECRKKRFDNKKPPSRPAQNLN